MAEEKEVNSLPQKLLFMHVHVQLTQFYELASYIVQVAINYIYACKLHAIARSVTVVCIHVQLAS